MGGGPSTSANGSNKPTGNPGGGTGGAQAVTGGDRVAGDNGLNGKEAATKMCLDHTISLCKI